jgi:hypothetical protein
MMKPNPFNPISQRRPVENKKPGMYKEFDATELYCPKCRQAVPVRKRLLLVLPEGDKYEYLCAYCATSVGTKIDRNAKPPSIII